MNWNIVHHIDGDPRNNDLDNVEIRTTSPERQKRYRDRKRGAPPRQLQPCGTVAAYKRHQRKGEPMDDACRKAWADWQREYQQRRS